MEEDCEVTLEANPGTVSAESLKSLHGLGFTRISFGMQSAHPQDLHILDRRHNFKDVLNAVGWSRQAGFEHINVDLIFGIPGQPLSRWQQNLALVTQLPVDHLSLYSLILEEGTPLYGWYQHGLIDLIDDDLTADMYEAAMELLPKAGYRQYEISNWAKERSDCLDARCRHNLNTWRYHPYFGLGAGASGFIEDTRRVNVGQIPVYLGKMKEMEGKWPAAETVTRLTLWEEMQEWMMVGLRKVEEGVSASEFRRRFDQPLEAVFGEQIGKLKKQGLLEEVVEGDDHLQLTKRGIMLGNRAFSEFIDNEKPSFIE
jgi:oxygen-independent coproporphyrinogen-3 oxidase